MYFQHHLCIWFYSGIMRKFTGFQMLSTALTVHIEFEKKITIKVELFKIV